VILGLLLISAALALTRQEKLQHYYDVNPHSKEYTTLRGWDAPERGGRIKFFLEDFSPVLTDTNDYIPDNRRKFIHSLGSIAKVKFVPFMPAIESAGYTGLLRGADTCLARISLAGDPAQFGVSPAVAVKCFRDGAAPTGNFIAMKGLEGQGSNTNMFQNTLSNHIREPDTLALKAVALKFDHYSKCAIQLSLVDFAEYDQFGVKTNSPHYPLKIALVPQWKGMSTHADTDFRDDLKKIPVGTVLWEIFVVNANCVMTKIAHLETTSKFVANAFGDQVMFFKHAKGEIDSCQTPKCF